MPYPIDRLHELGQSLWYDNIERRLLTNGQLERMIQLGEIRGVTSNPAIFQNAIVNSDDYSSDILRLSEKNLHTGQIYEELAIDDIRAVSSLLQPIYEKTNGGDGYVSLEVSPYLAYDTDATVIEAKRLWRLVDCPNLMIKIPATQAGLPAIRRAVSAGVNVNVTLIFSISRYLAVMDAYLSGLEDRLKEGFPIDRLASVGSFFVSRMDSKVDRYLNLIIEKGGQDAEIASNLLGKSAIANARLAYQEFKRVFNSGRYQGLKTHGARLQRPLWASTSTKNPNYPDTQYVDSLIGDHTINTVPQKTLDAFRDHGSAVVTIEDNLEEARELFIHLRELGISNKTVTDELEEEGVRAFADSYTALLKSIDARRKSYSRIKKITEPPTS